jgi:hypothetical protein
MCMCVCTRKVRYPGTHADKSNRRTLIVFRTDTGTTCHVCINVVLWHCRGQTTTRRVIKSQIAMSCDSMN